MATNPSACSSCRAPSAAVTLDGEVLCDLCADRRIAAVTGWPTLPSPPPAEVLSGPDGRRHTILYRINRWPGGVTARAQELGLASGGGYDVDLTIDHRADPRPVLERLRQAVRQTIAHPYLEPDEWHGWHLVGDQVAGRLTEDEADLPQVVVDGHPLRWEDFGRLLVPYVGWSFHLRLGDEVPPTGGGHGRAPSRPATSEELASATHDATHYVIDSSHYPTPADWQTPDHGWDR